MMRRAFTLLELLTVIAVIGCLMALVLPSLRYSKYQAQSVVCAANLRQMTLLMNNYAQFHVSYPPGFYSPPGYYLPPGGYVGNIVYDRLGWWWFHFLIDEQDGKNVLNKMALCPSSAAENQFGRNILCGNYGVNYSICKIAASNTDEEFVGSSLKPGRIRQPSNVLLLADSGYSLVSWKAATLNPAHVFECSERKDTFYVPGLSINSQKTINPNLETDAVNGRHPNLTINIGFADGGVKKARAETLLITTDTPSDCPAYFTWFPLNKR
jgi:prepilin-type N-terminal cleavage/methylation domain-containing protein/prepilin-type processing-associated H-X9-DG protein